MIGGIVEMAFDRRFVVSYRFLSIRHRLFWCVTRSIKMEGLQRCPAKNITAVQFD